MALTAAEARAAPPWAQGADGPVLLCQSIAFDGYDFAVRFPFAEKLPEVIKACCRDADKRWFATYVSQRGRRFYRHWRFSKGVIEEGAKPLYDGLQALYTGRGKESFEAFMRSFDDARERIEPGAFAEDIKQTIYPLKHGGVALIGSFHPGVVAVARAMNGSFLSAMRAWRLRDATAMTLKHNLMSELSLRDDQVEVLDFEYDIANDVLQQAANRTTIQTTNNLEPVGGSVSAEGEPEVYLAVTAPLKPVHLDPAHIEMAITRYSLYAYQQEGFRHLVRNTSALLADDMGLGKSRQATAAAHFLAQGGKVLIACPASLIINWTREIRMVVPDASIATQRYASGTQWVVTNYERLEEMLPHAHEFSVLITDEAHLLKDAAAKRTRLAFDIASKVPYRFILTGTPILNKESEIHTLLRLSGHPVGDIPLSQFEKEFSGEASFRAALNLRIREWMLRRKKDVVLKSLKGKQHQVAYLSPSAESADEYAAVANDSTLLALPKIQRLRVTLETIKIPHVVEMICAMNPDDKVLVFMEFKESVRRLKALLAERGVQCVTMVGDDSNTRRQTVVDRFQQDAEIRGFIGTTLAAGVGHNLTAANYVILGSLPWTAALKDQAEDRAYRIGQSRLVIVKVPLMENTIDADLWEMLLHKRGIATEILNPEEAEQAAMEAFAARLFKTPEMQ